MLFKPYVAALLILDPAMTAMGCAETVLAVTAELDGDQETETLCRQLALEVDRVHVALAELRAALPALSDTLADLDHQPPYLGRDSPEF